MEDNSIDFLNHLHQQQLNGWAKNIASQKIIMWLTNLLDILFPTITPSANELQFNWKKSKEDFTQIIQDLKEEKIDADECADALYNSIPGIYESLQSDAKALLNNDPAAVSIAEIINSYPGFFAIAIYRIANFIARYPVPSIPRILTEYAHSKTGIDIHPHASIDVPFVIDHGTGIVIGETAIIGKNVQIYQGVTLGALWVEKNLELKKRHPTVEHNVVIYANATILGGNTFIGNHSVIGGNTFITKSVNPYSVVQQSTKNGIINTQELKENISFTI